LRYAAPANFSAKAFSTTIVFLFSVITAETFPAKHEENFGL
jgi:hypothetical protein